ncbi:hypothetical protein B7494_g2712 [Chlorociboria aeruginascens]|nr:hypothetical protein B7494_g2712 [Chlorociboria aeruginascens]
MVTSDRFPSQDAEGRALPPAPAPALRSRALVLRTAVPAVLPCNECGCECGCERECAGCTGCTGCTMAVIPMPTPMPTLAITKTDNGGGGGSWGRFWVAKCMPPVVDWLVIGRLTTILHFLGKMPPRVDERRATSHEPLSLSMLPPSMKLS